MINRMIDKAKGTNSERMVQTLPRLIAEQEQAIFAVGNSLEDAKNRGQDVTTLSQSLEKLRKQLDQLQRMKTFWSAEDVRESQRMQPAGPGRYHRSQ